MIKNYVRKCGNKITKYRMHVRLETIPLYYFVIVESKH